MHTKAGHLRTTAALGLRERCIPMGLRTERRMSEKHLPSTGFVRLAALLAPGGPLPISKSSWWQGVRSGRYPAPVKLGPRITAWRVEDVRQLMELGIPLMRNPGPRAAGARKLNEQGTIGRSSYGDGEMNIRIRRRTS